MKASVIVLAIACVFMVAGASFAYVYHSDIGFSAELEGGDANVSVKGALPADIAYFVLSGTDVPEHIYLYLDQDYTGGFTAYREQKRTLDSLMDMMCQRGYCGAEYTDAAGLVSLCSDASAASVSGILFLSGAVPSTIYQSSENGLLTWLSNGGTVYWSGPDMGKYRALEDGSNESVEGGGYFGDSVNSSEEDYLVSKTSPVSETMGYAYCHAEYGLKADYPSSCILGLYDDYSSLSVVPVSSGRIYVLGQSLESLDVESMYAFTDIIVCGITESTVIKSTGCYDKGYGNGSFIVSGIEVGDTLYVTAGKPASVDGAVFRF